VIAAVAMDSSDDTRIGYGLGDTSAPLLIMSIIAALIGASIGCRRSISKL
jgi:hypothetical protein